MIFHDHASLFKLEEDQHDEVADYLNIHPWVKDIEVFGHYYEMCLEVDQKLDLEDWIFKINSLINTFKKNDHPP